MSAKHRDEYPTGDITWLVQVLARAALWAVVVGVGVVVGIAVVSYIILFVL